MNTKQKCIVCSKKSQDILCSNCLKNPFKIEICRQILAENKDYQTLKKYYKSSLPEIKNLNTPKFWNGKLKENEPIAIQDGMTRSRIRTVINLLPDTAKKILDIGAGHGFLEEFLSKKKDIQIYANDFSNESVNHLKEKYNGNFKVESVYKLEYKNNFFDTIFILEVLEHVPPSKILNVLSKVHLLLKKKGSLIISVPTNEGLENMTDNPNGHVRMYTIPLIKSELELAGFEVENVQTLHAFRSHYLLKSLVAKVAKNRWKPNNIIIRASIV